MAERREWDRALVLVHGATGYTGRLVCRALKRKKIRFAIAGRNARKLALLAESLGGVEECVIDLTSPASLRAALDRRVVVLACAGPFATVGEPMLAACAEHGVHYVDVCNEQPFVRRAFERHDAAARASKACIVPAMGFQSAPADWATQLLSERLGGALTSVDVAYVVDAPAHAATASRGSMRTAVSALARDEGALHAGGALHPAHDAALVRRFVTRDGTSVTAASFAGAESVVVPAHLAVARVRTFRAHAPLVARALQVTRGIAPTLARAGRDAIERLLAYASEGPDIETRASMRFEIVVQAKRGDARARLHLAGVDPYALTAEIQAHAADAALNGYVDACGVVAPSVGYPALAAFANLDDVLHLEGDTEAPPLRRVRRAPPRLVVAKVA